jgi:23S rRNA (guanosine2251-2'-O)-methyltransferase
MSIIIAIIFNFFLNVPKIMSLNRNKHTPKHFKHPKSNTKNNTLIWIYGIHACIAALKNKNRKCYKLFVTDKILKDYPTLTDLRPNLSIDIVSIKEISSILPLNAAHQGIAIEASPLQQPQVEDFYKSCSNISDQQDLVLILDQITDPQNIGAILRSAAAFNAKAVFILKNNSPGETSSMVKAACGAIEITPLITVTNLVQLMKDLKEIGFWCIGLDGKAQTLLSKVDLPKKVALILGSEDEGLRRLTVQNCDILAKLPISSKVESLNVSNAAAIAMYITNNN